MKIEINSQKLLKIIAQIDAGLIPTGYVYYGNEIDISAINGLDEDYLRNHINDLDIRSINYAFSLDNTVSVIKFRIDSPADKTFYGYCIIAIKAKFMIKAIDPEKLKWKPILRTFFI